MDYADKLRYHMRLKGLNQQKLAKAAEVSDSEVSRILSRKSQPGLENAFRLAKAVGVPLDYLIDDAQDKPPDQTKNEFHDLELDLIRLAKEISLSDAIFILRMVKMLGSELSLRRLLDAKPMIEIGEGSKSAPAAPSHAQSA
jgi:transcriptional regulator with XRE-family HTH domain